MEIVFWGSAFVIAYVYAGYPLLLALWARLRPRPIARRGFAAGEWPSLSIVVAARNEGARLPARVENLLQLDYSGRKEIILVSDGSSDGTKAALAPYADRIRFLEVPAGGKPLALNAGVAASSGEILVFADARQTFSPGALTALAANFADPQVGGATGELMLDCESGEAASTIGEGVGAYWKYEKWLRRMEGLIRSTLGATGCIYALRRSVWQPLPAETLLDDVLAPMRAVLGGWRIVFEEDALAFDRTAPDAAAEARRKQRTLAGNYQILRQEPRLLLPFANPVWLQYVSHKIGRLFVPWALVAALVSSAVLAPTGWTYATAFAAQGVFYGLAVVGAWLDSRDRHSGAPFRKKLPMRLEKEAR